MNEFKNLFKDEIKQKKKLKETKFDSKIIENKEDVNFIIDKIIKEYPNTNIDTFQSTLLIELQLMEIIKIVFIIKLKEKEKHYLLSKQKKG